MSEQKKSTKTTQTVDTTIESFLNQISKASQFRIVHEFDICFGAQYEVVKHDLKNGEDLDIICSKEVLGKDANLFAETQILVTTIKTSRTLSKIKAYPPLTFKVTQPLEHD